MWVINETRLDEELVSPAVERLEGGGYGDVVTEDAAVGAAVEGDAQRLEALLPGLHRQPPRLPPPSVLVLGLPLLLLALLLLCSLAVLLS